MKKVSFDEEKNQTRNMVTWEFAYRKARQNTFMYDRIRFERRIKLTELLLNDVLCNNHRCKIYESRFSNSCE